MDVAIEQGWKPKDAFRATVYAPGTAPPRATSPSRTVWWPVVLVGFVAVMCATVAFLKSPLARHPSVAPYASAVLAKVG